MKLLMHYLIIAAMILSFSISSCTGKKELSVGKPAFITATALNCRKDPSSTGVVVGSFVQSDMVKVLEKGTKKDTIDGKENYWFLVEKDATKGWVFGGYLAPALYDKTSDLHGNYYLRYGENTQPDPALDDTILALDANTYTLISYSKRNRELKAIDINGTVEYQDNMIILRPEKRRTRQGLLASGSPYGDPYQNSYQNSYQGGQNAGPVEEKNYSKTDSELFKQTLYLRKLSDKTYLVFTPAIFTNQVTKLPKYMEKK